MALSEEIESSGQVSKVGNPITLCRQHPHGRLHVIFNCAIIYG